MYHESVMQLGALPDLKRNWDRRRSEKKTPLQPLPLVFKKIISRTAGGVR